MPIHIHSLLFLFISSVLIPLFAIVLNFSFPFILISTHPILSLLLCYPFSILQSIFSSLSLHPPSLFYSIFIHPLIPFLYLFIIYPSFFPFIPFHIILSVPFYSHSILHPIPFQRHCPFLFFLSLLHTTLRFDSLLLFYCPLCSQTPFYYHSPHTSLFHSSLFIHATSIQFILFSPILSLTFY